MTKNEKLALFAHVEKLEQEASIAHRNLCAFVHPHIGKQMDLDAQSEMYRLEDVYHCKHAQLDEAREILDMLSLWNDFIRYYNRED